MIHFLAMIPNILFSRAKQWNRLIAGSRENIIYFFYSCERRKRRRALEIHYGSIYESEITRSITRVLETCASLDGETCSSFDSRRFIRGRCSPVLRYIFHCTRATLSCIIENRWTICGFLVCGGENDKHGWKGIFARLLYEENFQVRKNDGILS